MLNMQMPGKDHDDVDKSVIVGRERSLHTSSSNINDSHKQSDLKAKCVTLLTEFTNN